jgi:DNA primase
MFRPEQIEEVRKRTDVPAVVGQYVKLRKVGRSWTGCCPFHPEKTPSFRVEEDGRWYCHGKCKTGKDIIDLVMRLQACTFQEAVRWLAVRAGVPLEESEEAPERAAERRRQLDQEARLRAALEWSAEFFERCLSTPPPGLLQEPWQMAAREAALAELASRRLGDEVARQFRIGYAPPAWSALVEHLRSKGVSPADMEAAGLAVPSRRPGGVGYDRFRHRVMFPICDPGGRVVGFSGRLLPPTEGMPERMVPEDAGKYINTPETHLFRKGEHLLGLQAARPHINAARRLILCEGNFDAAALAQNGYPWVAAPCGTAFTREHAQRVARIAGPDEDDRLEVWLVFDPDEAGRKATRVAIQALDAHPRLRVRVVQLPRPDADGTKLDPDALMRRPGGPQAFRRMLARAADATEWLIDDARLQCGEDPQARAQALARLAGRVAALPEEARADYTRRLAMAFRFRVADVERTVARAPVGPAAAPAPPVMAAAPPSTAAAEPDAASGAVE